MFRFTHDLHKIEAHLDKLLMALTDGGGLRDTARKLAERHRQAFEDGGHQAVGGPAWEGTDPRWAEKMRKGHTRPMVWTGEAQKSIGWSQASADVAHVYGADYLGLFQWGPLAGSVPVDAEGYVVKDADSAFRMEPILRHQREVFYVADSDWNPFMQYVARKTGSVYQDTGSIAWGGV